MYGKEKEMFLKEIMKEELNNLNEIRNIYKKEWKKLPKGSLILKKIYGNKYYYLVYRKNGKVKFKYIGKMIGKKEKERYKEYKRKRRELKKKISSINNEIKIIKGILNGKQLSKIT